MTIVPGYDFFSTEIPTRAKLGLMASGMSVRDISFDQIATSILAISVTDGSQQSLPSEGWLWVDARHNIWGRTRIGNVIVRKSEGGWESIRYPYGPGGTASNFSRPGEIVQVQGMIGGNTNESNAVLVVQIGGSATGATWHLGVTQETVPSTATDAASPNYKRTVFRGATRLFGPDFTPPAGTMGRARGWRNAAFTNWWIFTDFDDNEPQVMYAESNQRDSDLQTDYVYGYFFPGLLTS